MTSVHPENTPGALGDGARLDAVVVEVMLLLTARDTAALETAAHRRGLTIGQMVRRLISNFLRRTAVAPEEGGRRERCS